MVPSAWLNGPGWELGGPRFLEGAREVVEVAADRPRDLGKLLDFLDCVAASTDSNLLAVGFLSYEAGVWLEGSRDLYRPPVRTPLAHFGLYDLSRESERSPPSLEGLAWSLPAERELKSTGRSEWFHGIEAIRAGIARGDVYQVSLTRRLSAPSRPDAFALADALFAENPVPFAATLRGGTWGVVSNSPELFLDAELTRGSVRSAPIKGTTRLGARAGDEVKDAARELLASEKDAAEHVMIVDLIRNDLGRVSVPGGVTVDPLRAIRPFAHLVHLESVVHGRLAPGTRLSDLLRATFPGGSVTGAPKRSALGFIRRLESCPRGPYTGAVGYVRGGGRCILNVAIRTAIVTLSGVEWHSGGGIVWDSDAGAEWEETVTKSIEFERVVGLSPARGCA